MCRGRSVICSCPVAVCEREDYPTRRSSFDRSCQPTREAIPGFWNRSPVSEGRNNRDGLGSRMCRGRSVICAIPPLSVRWGGPFAEGLNRVSLGESVEPGEQANALTAGKLGLGRAPAEE
jgi:hypothetical protein